MIFRVNTKTSTIARALRNTDILIRGVEFASDPSLEDDTIKITENIHVSVGRGYALVCVKMKSGNLKFYPSRTLLKLLLTDIREALKSEELK